MTQDPTTTAPARRVFIYGDHRFEDPGAEYAVEQIRTHLAAYFPELAHATTEEKTFPDGTVEVTFRKQVARKGSSDAGRLAMLLDELERIPPCDDPLTELTAALGTEPLSLAALLGVQESLRAHASDVYGLARRAEQVVKRCLTLPPSLLAQRPPRLLRLAPPAHEPPSVAPNPLTSLRLSLLLAAARLAQRYRQVFPGRVAWLEEVFDWQGDDAEEAFAEMVESFLERVEEHLFPVMVEVWDVEVDDALYYLDQIPIIPQGLEHWYYDDFDNYREPLALLLHVEHRHEHGDGDDTLKDAYLDYDFPAGLDLGVVAARLRTMAFPDPLSGLLDAIALVRHDCDNVWMDYSVSDLAEMGTDLPWDDAETVAWLTETWQEARPRLERVWALVDWCNPQRLGPPNGGRLETVINLLLDAYRTEQAHE